MDTNITPLQELDKFMGGALQERVAMAISEITSNIFDLNTKPDAAREVNIKMTIKPTKTRRDAVVTTKVTTKLAPLSDLETSAQIGIDADTGELIMVEQMDVLPGQINLNGETHEENIARFPNVTKMEANK